MPVCSLSDSAKLHPTEGPLTGKGRPLSLSAAVVHPSHGLSSKAENVQKHFLELF